MSGASEYGLSRGGAIGRHSCNKPNGIVWIVCQSN